MNEIAQQNQGSGTIIAQQLAQSAFDGFHSPERDETPGQDAASLLAEVDAAVEAALAQLRSTPRERLLEPRPVGRAAAPSNVLGLLVHAAEHAQRHAGQVVTTAKIVRAQAPA